jgi:hypothetical protein
MTVRLCAALIATLIAARGALAQGPAEPWWKCPEPTDTQRWWDPNNLRERPRAASQARNLDAFGNDRFGVGGGKYFSRAALIERYGKPLRTSSAKEAIDRLDPPATLTTWEYPGFRIVTAADGPKRRLRVWRGEVFDPKVELGADVAVGQSIEQWEKAFGRPDCDRGFLQYEWWSSSLSGCGDHPCQEYFRMDISIDASGRVVRVKWLHSDY